MQKRGQGFEHVIVYIMIAIVTILILFFGYKAFESGKQRHEDSTMIQFETSLSSDLESVRRNVGSVVHKTYSVPNFIKEVCMNDDGCAYITPTDCWKFEDDILSEMLEEDFNVFLIPFPEKNMLPIAYKMGNLQLIGKVYKQTDAGPPAKFKEVDQHFNTMCFPVNNGQVDILIGGAGSETIVRPAWSVANGTSKEARNIVYCHTTDGNGDISGTIYEKPYEDMCFDKISGSIPKKFGENIEQ